MGPSGASNPFSEEEHWLVRHRMLTECARHGLHPDEAEIAGRAVPVQDLVDALMAEDAVPTEVYDQVRLWSAWCRLHDHNGMARLLDTLSKLRRRQEEGLPPRECQMRLWRFLELRTSADLVDPVDRLESMGRFLEAYREHRVSVAES